jgi:hypothetical protein
VAQSREGAADHGAADAEHFGEGHFLELRAGGELMLENRVADCVEHALLGGGRDFGAVGGGLRGGHGGVLLRS